MNYYERHLGDYAKNAGHLSMLEHGAYTLLLDRYYSSEAGIPADKAYKFAKASKKEERDAVDSVLAEFFTLVDGLWIKNRVEEEIQRYLDSIPEAEAKKENDKDRQRRARERRKVMFQELAGHGVVMPWNSSIGELQAELSRVKSQDSHAPVTPPVTRDNPATTRHPDSSLQSPEDSLRGEAPSIDRALYAEARTIFGASIGGQISKAIKLKGKPWILGVIESCRKKDQEQARSYLAAAMNGAHKPDEAELRRTIA